MPHKPPPPRLEVKMSDVINRLMRTDLSRTIQVIHLLRDGTIKVTYNTQGEIHESIHLPLETS